jgi:hypothetical protein
LIVDSRTGAEIETKNSIPGCGCDMAMEKL